MRSHPLALLAAITAFAVGGCGEEEPSAQKPADPTPAPTTPVASSPAASTPPAVAEEDKPAAEPKPDPTVARDKRRAKQFLKDYGADGRKRWLIKSVTVEDGAITVKTGLFPKASNEPKFTGACSALMDWEDWMTSLEVLGSDGAPHATWTKGDDFCDIDV